MEEDKQGQESQMGAQSKEGNQSSESKDVQENKIWAVMSYLGVLALVPLLGKKDSPFAQFHAKQGLILLIAWAVSWFPIFGWIIGIIAFVLSVIGIINALNGEMKKLPIVGDLAEKLKLWYNGIDKKYG